MRHIPAISYPGGKARLASTIVSYFPTCGTTYVEPFAGRGNTFWVAASTLDYSIWWLNDIRTTPFFKAILAAGDTVTIPERTRAQYDLCKRAAGEGDPTAIIAEPFLTHSGRGYLYSGARGTGGGPGQLGYQSTIRQCHRILHATSPRITALDWSEVVKGMGSEDFAYFDSPYIDANVGCYSATDLNHEEMVRVLEDAPFRWVLSEYEHPLYVSRLGHPFFRTKVRRMATVEQEDAEECLWRNF